MISSARDLPLVEVQNSLDPGTVFSNYGARSPFSSTIQVNVRKGKHAERGTLFVHSTGVCGMLPEGVILNTMLDTETDKSDMVYQNFKQLVVRQERGDQHKNIL